MERRERSEGRDAGGPWGRTWRSTSSSVHVNFFEPASALLVNAAEQEEKRVVSDANGSRDERQSQCGERDAWFVLPLFLHLSPRLAAINRDQNVQSPADSGREPHG